ncbi:hypothetical protein BS47DRAFT_1321174 [Hydnum rufescens UP504]|uniref:Arrestin-like N-terminal domain-containing protein n=1 Tax=Hydnum rufescens UP504 TaxID=1448309 RepID=A0A9P6ALL0_9AGAM|nr:hypothetical protein BS47DRAFT_1321174 [Hydnum rufescens UP504]
MLPQLLVSPTIKLTLNQTFTFLRPSPAPEHIPSADPMVTGMVTLTLPRRKYIKSLSVRLIRIYSLLFSNDEYEAGRTTEVEVSLASPKEERLFERGQHHFAFTIILPSSLAPTEGSQLGRIFYKIVATAKGDGIVGSDVTTYEKIIIIASPTADGETNDLNLWMEGFHAEIGPYAVSTVSQHLTVGGILNFNLILAHPPATILIHSVSAFICTAYGIKSIKTPTKRIDRVTQRLCMFVVNRTSPPDSHFASDASCITPGSGTPIATSPGSFHHAVVESPVRDLPPSIDAPSTNPPLVMIPEGHSYQLTHLGRVPSDGFIRSSTLLGTRTPLNVAHELVFEVTFETLSQDSPKGKSTLKLQKPITISSCCCILENLLVPIYSEVEVPVVKIDTAKTFEDRCVCATSKDQLVLQQRLAGMEFIRVAEGRPTKAEYRLQH